MRKLFFLLLLLLCWSGAFSQGFKRTNLADTTVNAKLLSFGYAFEIPLADLANRFGSNNSINTSFMFKMSHNFLLGIEGTLIFGGNIKEDTIIDGLFTSQGFLIGSNGIAESVILFERGYTLFGKFGKVFPAFHSNPNSGICVLVGAGFIQHKIKIEDPDNAVPYVTGDYAKGYDRLTNGGAISQYIGWMNLDKRKLKNFNAGIELMEGFTQNRRSINFDTMQHDGTHRLDMLLSFKVSLTLPFYGRGERRFYTR